MDEKPQSYFGDVLKKLSEMGERQNVPLDQSFKQQLRNELKAQDLRDVAFEKEKKEAEAEDFSEPIVGAVEMDSFDNGDLVGLFKKWQALFIGLPAFFVTVLAIIFLRVFVFGESGPVSDFEKQYNVTYSGYFSVLEKANTWEPVLKYLGRKREISSVRISKKNQDKIYLELYRANGEKEDFWLYLEDKWRTKAWELVGEVA